MADAYDLVNEQILEIMKQGELPWNKPWNCSNPKSMATGKAYQGINLLLLAMAPYSDSRWITLNNATKLMVEKLEKAGISCETRKSKRGRTYYVRTDTGDMVKAVPESEFKKGRAIVFWKWVKKEKIVDGKKEERSFPFLRYFKVWNVEQTTLDLAPEETVALDFEPLEACESIVNGYEGIPEINHGGNVACYSPISDEIGMPAKEAFHSVPEYYSTLFHEMGHSTGHKSRLDRGLVGGYEKEKYSREELVAELTAAYLCSQAGIEKHILDNSAAYIAGWQKRIKDDPKAFVLAAGKAQKSADLIRGIEPEETE